MDSFQIELYNDELNIHRKNIAFFSGLLLGLKHGCPSTAGVKP